MFCKIADLVANLPASDGLAVRCSDYLCPNQEQADITVKSELYRNKLYPSGTSKEEIAYLESSYQFYKALVAFGGFYLHASTVVKDGKAYLFSAPCGTGKSTHTQLWVDTFGGDTRIINDDKPALRKIDNVWYAYGTPWCGKAYINSNEKAPVAGVCFLKQAPHNKIRKMGTEEALKQVLTQTIFRFDNVSDLDKLLATLTDFLSSVPIYELENLPEADAAKLSFETMRK